MCDYSLHLVGSLPAKVGDKLVATDFSIRTIPVSERRLFVRTG